MEDELEDFSGSEDEPRPVDAIFVQEFPRRGPIPMYLHGSLSKGGKAALTKRITEAGGQITTNEEHANVIICRDDHLAFPQLQHKYDHHRYVHVEPPSWVGHCLRIRRCKHAPAGKVTISKRNSGRSRSDFTRQDDKNLAQYLARRLPYKKLAGRVGNGVYKDLVSAERASIYPWAKNHPWQSWRERYKKNEEIFDRAIQRIVATDPDPPKPGEQGQYFVKGRKPIISLKHMVEHDNWEEEEEEEEEEAEAEAEEEEEEEEVEVEGEEEDSVEAPALVSRERRSSRAVPLPRKKPRPNKEPEENASGDPHNKGKEMRKEYSEAGYWSPQNDLEFVDDMAHDVPGPSQFDGAHVDDQISAPPSAHASVRTQRRRFSNMPSTTVHSPKRRKLSAPRRDIYEEPQDTQMTVVENSGVIDNPNAPPPDTQATLVQSPERRSRQSRQFHAGTSHAPRPARYPNTRSRPQPASEYPAPEVQPDPQVKRGRGRPRKIPPPVPPSPLGVSIQQSGTASSHVVATTADEARVEALLHSEERDSVESLSSDDQDAQNLLQENSKLLAQPFRMTGIENSRPSYQPSSPPPHIDLERRGRAASASRQNTILRPTMNTRIDIPESAHETDSNPTPKAGIRIRAAKKVAARNTAPSAESEGEQQSGSWTDTSVPAEETHAWEFKIARTPFKPSPGTRAEQYARNSKIKGKEKAG